MHQGGRLFCKSSPFRKPATALANGIYFCESRGKADLRRLSVLEAQLSVVADVVLAVLRQPVDGLVGKRDDATRSSMPADLQGQGQKNVPKRKFGKICVKFFKICRNIGKLATFKREILKIGHILEAKSKNFGVFGNNLKTRQIYHNFLKIVEFLDNKINKIGQFFDTLKIRHIL